MSQRLTQQQQQRLVQRLAPQQVRFVRLLEMNREEAEDAVERELEANPALGEEERDEAVETMAPQFAAALGDVPYYRLKARNTSADDGPSMRDIALMNAAQQESLYDHLRRQLDERDLSPDLREAARYVVDSLDSDGCLRRTPEAMADDMSFTTGTVTEPELMRRAVALVRTLDPPGTGASGLQDVLAMQLEAMPPSAARDNALRIVRDAFEPLSLRQRHRIISQLRLRDADYSAAMDMILALNPRPGASFGSGESDRAAAVVPDFAVEEDGSGELHVSIPTRVPGLEVDAAFTASVADMERNAAERKGKKNAGEEAANAFTMQLYRDARDFIEIWNQRQTTLMAVMTAIVKLQRRYFTTSDDSDLRPMALRDIAALTGYDLSTISRATSGKYVATSWGIIPLRHLFSERMASAREGDEAGGSARSIQAALRSMVEAEDKRHPLSDEEITGRLQGAGFDVKRRTVAKYREAMQIPSSRLRREL